MPKKPTKGTKLISVELPIGLVDEAKSFAAGRGESLKDVIVRALRRDMDNAPPVPDRPAPPPLPPLPPGAPPAYEPKKRGRPPKPKGGGP